MARSGQAVCAVVGRRMPKRRRPTLRSTALAPRAAGRVIPPNDPVAGCREDRGVERVRLLPALVGLFGDAMRGSIRLRYRLAGSDEQPGAAGLPSTERSKRLYGWSGVTWSWSSNCGKPLRLAGMSNASSCSSLYARPPMHAWPRGSTPACGRKRALPRPEVYGC